MTENRIEDEIRRELAQAVSCEANEQYGKARVLARRAVGMACQALLKTQGHLRPGLNALDSIKELRQSNLAKPDWKPLLSHFLLQVDTDRNLPDGIDLVDEADYLISEITKTTLTRNRNNGKD